MTKRGKAAGIEVIEPLRPSLPELCSEAADHVARARIALDDGALDPDRALIHLDEAIACLKRLRTHGNASRASLRSA